MVVDHVEDYLDPGLVEPLDHGAEPGHPPGPEIARLGRKKANGVVAPVIHQPLVAQHRLGFQRLHRQKLHRRDAQPGQMVEHRVGGHAVIGAAQVFLDALVQHGGALDMGLVDQPAVMAAGQRPCVEREQRRIGDHRFRHMRCAVAGGKAQVVTAARRVIAIGGVMVGKGAAQLAGIGIDQQLVGIEAVAARRFVRAVDAVAVKRARHQPRHIAVPDRAVALGQVDAMLLAPSVGREQAQGDPGGIFGKDGKVGAFAVEMRTELMRAARTDFDRHRRTGVHSLRTSLYRSA